MKVLNPERASYGISDYIFAITQLAQTTLRSEIGKIDLDKTFEERTTINTAGRQRARQGVSEPWGVKVLRYEIKNITPPDDILAAMEKQMRAEREKRAVILTSEGKRDAAINTAEGEKQQVIKASEARKQQQINEAEGQAAAIRAVATATAEGIRQVAAAIKVAGGMRGHAAARRRAVRPAVRPARQGDDHAGRAGQRGGRRWHDCARDAGDQSAKELSPAHSARTRTMSSRGSMTFARRSRGRQQGRQAEGRLGGRRRPARSDTAPGWRRWPGPP